MTAAQPLSPAERAVLSSRIRRMREIADCASLYEGNELLTACIGIERLLAALEAAEQEAAELWGGAAQLRD